MSYDSTEDSTLQYAYRWARWGLAVLFTVICYPPLCMALAMWEGLLAARGSLMANASELRFWLRVNRPATPRQRKHAIGHRRGR